MEKESEKRGEWVEGSLGVIIVGSKRKTVRGWRDYVEYERRKRKRYREK